MLSRLRSYLLGALVFSSACRSWPTRRPMRLVRPAPPIAADRCEPTPEPGPPTGRTPPPIAEGTLSLVDLRGDDRLAVVDEFATAWSPDGERIYTATRTAVLAWGTRSGALEASWPLAAPMDSVDHVVVSPDGTWIGVGGSTLAPGASASDRALVVWLLRTGEHPAATMFPGVGGALYVSADGRRMVARGHAWDLATGEHHTTPTPPSPLSSLFWMPDGLRAVVITWQPAREGNVYTAVLWDAVTGREIHRFPSAVNPAAVSADGERVAVLHDGLDVFSTRTFERVAHMTGVPARASVSLSRDGRRAVVETHDCPVYVYLLLYPPCPLEPLDPNHPFLEPDACQRPVASRRCPPPFLDLWDVDRAVRLARTERSDSHGRASTGDDRFLVRPEWRQVSDPLRVNGLARVALGDRVRSVSPDGRFALYENGPALAVAALDGPPLPDFERPARVIARSADGTRTAALDADGRLRVEGPGSCVRLALVAISPSFRRPLGTEHLDPARDSVAFSDDGATLVVLTHGYGSQPRVRALDSRTGAERWSMQVTDGNAAAFLTAGTVLVQGENRPEVLRYDASTGALFGTGRAPRRSYTTPGFGRATSQMHDDHGDLARGLARVVATAGGSRVGTMGRFGGATWFSRWDLAHPERVVDVRVDDEIDRIAVSPDGVWAVALHGGGVRLYRDDGEPAVEVDAGHRGPVTALAFSATGDRLFSADGNGTLAVTAVATGRVSGRARFPMDGVTSLWVSPDGSELRVETRRGMRARFRCR